MVAISSSISAGSGRRKEYDTGFGRKERYFTPTPERVKSAWQVPEEDELPNQLKRLNVPPEDVRYVICSHLHIDHTGYLELFTNAEVIVSNDEFSAVSKLHASKKLDFPFVSADFEAWMKAGLNWHFLEEDVDELDLVAGIRIFNFDPGHAFGMLGAMVELEETGNILLISDAIYSAENLGPPIKPPGFLEDHDGFFRTAGRIVEISQKYNAEIWCGHDMAQFEKKILMDDGYYR